MKCPHCATAIHDGWSPRRTLTHHPAIFSLRHMVCPECDDFIVELTKANHSGSVDFIGLVWPIHAKRPVPPEVESRFATDYAQAAAILGISPKASAALSRRLVQDVIREKAGIKKSSLDGEITELIASGQLPSWLSANLDAIRAVGNFAAHPIKSTNTGEVVDVEPGEAEFLLDVLDDLFDFYFVQPQRAKLHLDGINAKLAEAGKPPLKEPKP